MRALFRKVTQEAYVPGSVRRETGSLRPTSFTTGRLHQSTEFVIRALVCEPVVISFEKY